VGAAVSLSVAGAAWVESDTVSPLPRTTSVPSAWYPDPCSRMTTIDKIRHGPKSGGAVPLSAEGAGSPCNAMSHQPRLNSVGWPLYSSNRLARIREGYRQDIDNRTDRQDNCRIAKGEPFYKRSPQNRKYYETKLESVSVSCKSHRSKTADINFFLQILRSSYRFCIYDRPLGTDWHKCDRWRLCL